MKLIILDRDGVINHDSPDFIKSPAEWIPIPGSLEAIARLNQAGYRVVIASNQSGIAREFFDMSTLNAIHAKMHHLAQQVGADIDAAFIRGDFADALKTLAQLRDEVDAFFNDVMVMAEDVALRNNRLALLSSLHGMMNRVADISKLAA